METETADPFSRRRMQMDRKTRIVSFRISEQEYRLLERSRLLQGSTSVSDHVRSLARTGILAQSNPVSYATQIEQLYRTIRALHEQVLGLTRG